MSILENIYYGNIDPHEHSISGGDKDKLIENVVRLEHKSISAFSFSAVDKSRQSF